MDNTDNQQEFFASCLSGLERQLSCELQSFGIKRTRPLRGGVAFFCEPVAAMRACLWSRLASRILMVIARVDAHDADALYTDVAAIAWEDIMAPNATCAVRAHGTNNELRNTRFTALRVKDAVADRLREYRGERIAIDVANPRVAIDVRIHDRKATLSLDFSGEALNHRSYLVPDDGEDAALECSMAAGLLAIAGWGTERFSEAAFFDPVCSIGVLIVEAAGMACDQAPGLLRERWGFFGWSGFDQAAFDELVAEADERFERGLARVVGEDAVDVAANARPDLKHVRFVGTSSSSPSISRAREHVRRAGLRQAVSIEIGDAESVAEVCERVCAIAALKRGPEVDGADGEAPITCLVASNLNAQARGDARAHVQADEAAFVAACEAASMPARFIVAGGEDVEARFGAEPSEKLVIGSGRVELPIAVFEEAPRAAVVVEVPDTAGGAPHKVEVFEEASEQFAARLRKVYRERRKWAAREGISCYRIYDADLPDYAVAIDVYTGSGDARGNTYLHISEYAPPASIDPNKARRRFDDVLVLAPVVCGVRPDHVFSKTRRHGKGGAQYRNAGHRSYVTTVEEGGYTFEVDLAGRLDTGLFLDHRPIRQFIEKRAEGADFLNLFAYTGTASVYAAGGGAASTTTVDLSQTYVDWARRNMERNGFTGREHVYEREDAMRWITQARRSGRRFDLIFVDPPTFSNSKAMGKRTWDVQRDHVELLIGVTHLLKDGGEAIFSCNLRSFKPYLNELEKYKVSIRDISADTIPHDFARTPKVHKCYIVKRMA